MTTKKVLLIYPHPDDIEMAMGMRVYGYAQEGFYIHELILSRGELGGDPNIRESEARSVADVLGINELTFCNHSNTRFAEERVAVKDSIERIVAKVQPDKKSSQI